MIEHYNTRMTARTYKYTYNIRTWAVLSYANIVPSSVLVASGGAGRALPMAVVSRYNICWCGSTGYAWIALRGCAGGVIWFGWMPPAVCGWSPPRHNDRPEVAGLMWYVCVCECACVCLRVLSFVGSMCSTNGTLPIHSLAKFQNVLKFMVPLQLLLFLRLLLCLVRFTCVGLHVRMFTSHSNFPFRDDPIIFATVNGRAYVTTTHNAFDASSSQLEATHGNNKTWVSLNEKSQTRTYHMTWQKLHMHTTTN